MHILLIGLGNMGQKYLNKIEEMGESPILCDIDPEKAKDSRPFYCHYGDVKEDIKAVVIAINPENHVKVSQEFLKRDIPVLLEKPPALSVEEFEKIEKYPNLFISEVESYSICVDFFKRESLESLEIYRLGKGKGYISPLWDLAWHDLYLMLSFFKEVEIDDLEKKDVWCIRGRADGIPFKLCTAWEHPNPQRVWVLNSGQIILDFAEESVYEGGKLLLHRKRDKLRWMLEDFLFGRYSKSSTYRAKKILGILSRIDG